ncbi:fumarylacetoacetate hydrolase family protein [Chelatococcus asaccharovorans]|uniref:2-keto-4-pentenoate hydratase/2-oxohepta-3-ene-1,7-dioic acid hydratase in catechol pathway n=1 Tax=Chelatococcus asaccharovorans TaxID=28210 RepID=A0A2V3TSA2_9HYPH|nr:fumarylacetoacetate hydrolase family protein [Chelatococcus asaccharovorans]MBS7707831.1 fumarylacetoacetate hydrolase family protein [Chelatococcus asaccharovorans]PXW50922.1 2-keto-4-pentenoate hydratase/2-oxohepta-3-ene-1,7-dioic acid hydratase in catechol pathway [Chelatococcus asaccharovorans]
MRVISFSDLSGRQTYGLVDGDTVLDMAGLDGLPNDVRGLVATDGWARTLAAAVASAPRLNLKDVTFLPVVTNPSKILCVGINYASHVIETGREMPAKPMIFTRFASSQIGHAQPLLKPAVSSRFDFEGELAVIVGKGGRYLSKTESLEAVAGYSIYNDGSVRDWQRHTLQWTPGKNFPATGAFGPWLVTPDEMGPIGTQRIVTRVNGKVMQDGRLDDLIFDVRCLVSYCSHFTPLEPGDVIITGTTGGVGAFREPPVWLEAGDVVDVEIDGIGVLSNAVADDTLRPRERGEWL